MSLCVAPISPGNFDKKTAKLDKSTKPATIVPQETPINSGYGAHLSIALLLWKINQEVKVNNCANFGAFIHFCSITCQISWNFLDYMMHGSICVSTESLVSDSAFINEIESDGNWSWQEMIDAGKAYHFTGYHR